MKRRPRRRSKGFGLVTSLATLAVTGILAAAAAAAMRTLLRDSVYQERLLQAQAIAESGADDALAQLSADAGWRAGFDSKACLGGYYDVSVSTDAFPTVTSTGRSRLLAVFGRAHRTVRLRARLLPIPQLPYGAASASTLSLAGQSSVDSYNSEQDLNPARFGRAGNIWSNENLLVNGAGFGQAGPAMMRGAMFRGRRWGFQATPPPTQGGAQGGGVFGDATYMSGAAPPAGSVTGRISKGVQALSLLPEDGSAYADANDNSAGLAPSSFYDPDKKTFNVPLNSTGTVRSGVYYLNGLTVAGFLRLDLTDGPVVLYLNGSLAVYGAVGNSSRVPANLLVYGLGQGGAWTIAPQAPFYGVIHAPGWDMSLNGTFFGAVEGRRVFLSGAALHYDQSLLRPKRYAARVLPNSWSVGFRQ